jgi:tRNA(fMet)-specific endonuclease VapC
MYVLDTNTLIYFFRGEGRVSENLLSQSPVHIAIPIITVYELKVGIRKSQRPRQLMQQLDAILQSVAVLDLGAEEAEASADIRAQLEQAGTPIGPYDILIAGICRAHGGTLVTHNTAEFGKVPDLHITDWYA